MTNPMAIDYARSLVRIPSVNPSFDPSSPGEVDVAAFLIQWAADNGFELVVEPVAGERSNVLVTTRRGGSNCHLLLNGHMDTVSVAGMTIDPFAAVVRDGRLYGRGAADMKGPLACMMAAMMQLRDTSQSWSGAVTLAAVVDEEFRFAGIRKLLESRPVYDFAIVGEPTELEVIRGCKGCLRFAVTTHGRAAHSSRPLEGASAISAMAIAIAAIEKFFAERLLSIRDPDFGTSTGSIGLIKGGVGVNIVPDHCEIEIDIRLLPDQDGHVTHRELVQALRMVLLPNGTSVEVSPPNLCDPGFALAPDHPFVETLVRTLGSRPAGVVTFCCDASKIAPAGIPCVVLGPGSIAQAHTVDESIAIDELAAGADAYFRIALALLD